MSLTRKILGNTFWQIFGRFATAIIAFLTVKFLTQYWGGENIERGQAVYGDYITVYEFLTFFGAMADLGIFTIAVREMSKHKEEIQDIFSSAIILRFTSLVMALLLAAGIAFLIPQYQETVIPKSIAIAAIGSALLIISGTFSSILLVHLKMKYHALALVAGKIITFGIIVAIIFFFSPDPTTESFYSLIWAGVWGSLVTLGFTIFYVRQYLSFSLRWNPKMVKDLFTMALPFGLATFLNVVYFKMDIFMLGTLLPRSDETGKCLAALCGNQQAGVYGVAIRIMDVLIILPLYFMNSVLPSLSSAIQEKKVFQVTRRLSMSALFLFLVSLPAVIGLFLLAKPMVEMLTPENFGSDTALKILVFPLFFTFFTTFLNFILIAFGEQKKILWINFYALLINFFLNIWVIPLYGYIGAAFTSLIAEGFILVLGFYFVFKIIRFPIEWKKVFGGIVAATIMGIFTFYSWKYWGGEVGNKALLGIIPLAMILYGGVLFLSKVVDREMFGVLKHGKISKSFEENL